jgi:hypothetical protein
MQEVQGYGLNGGNELDLNDEELNDSKISDAGVN